VKTNYVLIDYENIQPELGQMLADEVFQLLVFVGATQAKISLDTAMAVQAKGAAARYVPMAASGRNALDFHMACYLGELGAQDPEAYFHVISRDKGLDPLLDHLQKRGRKVARHETVAEIAIVKGAAPAHDDARCSLAIENLLRRSGNRPATLKTLRNTLASLFQPPLDNAGQDQLVQSLLTAGVVVIDGERVVYGLPD